MDLKKLAKWESREGKKFQLTIRVLESDMDEINKLAKAEHVTPTQLGRYFLRTGIESFKKRGKK